MSRTTYDPDVIRRFADHLYRRANYAVVAYTGGFALLGFVLAEWARWVGRAFRVRSGEEPMTDLLVTLVVVPLAVFVGYALGTERAFALRLQAQTSLCQVEIEERARATATLLVTLVRGASPTPEPPASVGSSEPEAVAPGWRNWQTQRT